MNGEESQRTDFLELLKNASLGSAGMSGAGQLTRESPHMTFVVAVPNARTKALDGRVSCHIS